MVGLLSSLLGDLNSSLPYLSLNFNESVLLPVDVSKNCWTVAGSVDPVQTAYSTTVCHLIWVCTVCYGLSFPLLKVITLPTIFWMSFSKILL